MTLMPENRAIFLILPFIMKKTLSIKGKFLKI